MTTKLDGTAPPSCPSTRATTAGPATRRTPRRHRTAYLWEEVWQRDGWLEILGRYMVAEQDKKKQIAKVIFPRFHQLDATRKLQAAVLDEGPGSKYLIQHSAGSGKTNSIAWSAHFLADLHDARTREGVRHGAGGLRPQRDRRPASGSASSISSGRPASSRRSRARAAARAGSWPRPSPATRRSSSARSRPFPSRWRPCGSWRRPQGKRFAVIADEAHSSQTGEAAAKLKEVLSRRGTEGTGRRRRGQHRRHPGRPDGRPRRRHGHHLRRLHRHAQGQDAGAVRPPARPGQPAGADNLPAPFHVYSMRQAIEERFILDVLQNYTSYKLAFKLANDGKDYDDTEVERSAAMKGMMRWVRLHPYNIAQKVQIVVEHFRALRRAAARRQGQGDGGRRQPAGGGALAARHQQVHQGEGLPAWARWWRSRAR